MSVRVGEMKDVKEVNGKAVPERRAGFYVIDENRVYPSVTTILSAIAKPFLIPWAARQVFERVAENPSLLSQDASSASKLIYAVRDAAGIQGTTIHSWAEAIKQGAKIDYTALPEALQGYGRAFDEWARTYQPILMHRELKVWSDVHQIAGKVDMILGLHDNDQVSVIVDMKTSKNIYPEFSLQLSAYEVCAMEMRSQGLLDIPSVGSKRILHLLPDGSYQFKPMEGSFEVFLAVKKVWEWSQKHE